MLKSAISALALIAAAGLAQAQDAADEAPLTVIHAGWLLAVPGEAPLEDQSILVRGDRIERVEAGFVSPDGATIVDLSDDYVMPGFIDSHVHLQSELGPGRRFNGFTHSAADFAFDGAVNARTTLMAGFTTVQDVGGNFEASLALRDAIDDGDVAGPRLRVAGSAVTPTAALPLGGSLRASERRLPRLLLRLASALVASVVSVIVGPAIIGRRPATCGCGRRESDE